MGWCAGGQHHAMARAATKAKEMLLSLEPRPESARVVRRALAEHGLSEEVRQAAGLLATELIANAVRHAGMRRDERIVFSATLATEYARVEVADPGRGFDPSRVRGDGYGLRLLERLASRWGVDQTDGRCRVWFEIDGRPGRFPRRA